MKNHLLSITIAPWMAVTALAVGQAEPTRVAVPVSTDAEADPWVAAGGDAAAEEKLTALF